MVYNRVINANLLTFIFISFKTVVNSFSLEESLIEVWERVKDGLGVQIASKTFENGMFRSCADMNTFISCFLAPLAKGQ